MQPERKIMFRHTRTNEQTTINDLFYIPNLEENVIVDGIEGQVVSIAHTIDTNTGYHLLTINLA